jgi:hypothetical protein
MSRALVGPYLAGAEPSLSPRIARQQEIKANEQDLTNLDLHCLFSVDTGLVVTSILLLDDVYDRHRIVKCVFLYSATAWNRPAWSDKACRHGRKYAGEEDVEPGSTEGYSEKYLDPDSDDD